AQFCADRLGRLASGQHPMPFVTARAGEGTARPARTICYRRRSAVAVHPLFAVGCHERATTEAPLEFPQPPNFRGKALQRSHSWLPARHDSAEVTLRDKVIVGLCNACSTG